MKIIYTILLMGILISGLYGWVQIQRVSDRHKAQVQAQFEQCMEKGKSSAECALDRVILSGLQEKSC